MEDGQDNKTNRINEIKFVIEFSSNRSRFFLIGDLKLEKKIGK
jgi:hypothetical protein